MGVFSFLTRPPTTDSPFSLLQNLSLLTRVDESVDPDDVFRIFPSLSVMLASRVGQTQPLLVYGLTREFIGPQKENNFSTGFKGYHRFSKVEDDSRWQTLQANIA
ncbi:hypothetical protein BDZ89DRAFT_1084830, partial [Hymenopellis radicata]